MIPGSNLLNQALTVIAQQTLTYYAFAGRVLNAVGQDINTYLNPQIVTGSFQPVPRQLLSLMGLDFQKSYFYFYVSKAIIDPGRDVSGDQLVFQGNTFQCVSVTEWFGIDGWVAVLCVQITTNISPNQKSIFGFDVTPAISKNQNFYNANFSPGADG